MRNSRASLFLMELMISILFFSLSSAVCIQLFVKAHTINESTEQKSSATLIAQDISEYFHHTGGEKESFLSYFAGHENNNSQTFLYFTENGISCTAENAYYTVSLLFGNENSYNTLTFEIHCMDNQEILYSSTLKKSFDIPKKKTICLCVLI